MLYSFAFLLPFGVTHTGTISIWPFAFLILKRGRLGAMATTEVLR